MSSDLATWEDKVSLMQQCPTTPVGVKQTLKTGGGSAMHGNQVANVSYPVPRKRERSLHTCAQDVQITRMATI
jgi:hypothetical protein